MEGNDQDNQNNQPGPPPQHKKNQSSSDGMVKYQFQNNLALNCSTNSNMDVNISFDRGLSNKFIGFNLNNSEYTYIVFNAWKNFEYAPKDEISGKYKHNNNPNSQNQISSSYFNSEIRQTLIFSEIDIIQKTPTSSEDSSEYSIAKYEKWYA